MPYQGVDQDGECWRCRTYDLVKGNGDEVAATISQGALREGVNHLETRYVQGDVAHSNIHSVQHREETEFDVIRRPQDAAIKVSSPSQGQSASITCTSMHGSK